MNLMRRAVVDIEKFRKNVYEAVAAGPRGKVTTYGHVARLAGFPHHARLAGRVLGETPSGLRLPCHRVVNASGRLVPHWPGQRSLLEAEGVAFRSNGCVNMKECLWNWEDE